MKMLDNSIPVAAFCPATDDGDTFIYTEMLDRGQKKGNNGQRLLKTFYHRSVKEFWEQWPTMKKLADMAQIRLCTRLAPRSWKKVGKEHARLVMEAVLTENWAGMKSQYNRACGIVSPNTKLWLFDIDKIDDGTNKLANKLEEAGHLIARIPSKKAEHFITHPFDPRGWVHKEDGWGVWGEVSLHKDNPTNLYIPDGAD